MYNSIQRDLSLQGQGGVFSDINAIMNGNSGLRQGQQLRESVNKIENGTQEILFDPASRVLPGPILGPLGSRRSAALRRAP